MILILIAISLHICIYVYIIQNKHICEYAIIHKNILKLQNLNLRDLEQFILENYPQILEINNYLDDELSSSYEFKYITDDRIFLSFLYYFKKELSNLIFDHNKNLVIPRPNQYLYRKKKILD